MTSTSIRPGFHFTGLPTCDAYRAGIQASSVRVYPTVPFVLSWSLIEVMACGGLVVASDPPPVRAVVEDEVSGLLVDFFASTRIAARIDEALEDDAAMERIREAARESVVERFALERELPQHVQLVEDLAGRSPSPELV